MSSTRFGPTRTIGATQLIAQLDAVLAGVSGGAVYEVEGGFFLGPPEQLGAVFGLIDEAYGWPYPVERTRIQALEDLRPGYRRHPVVLVDGRPVAMVISRSEYETLCDRLG